MPSHSYPRVASFKTPDAFRQHLRACGATIELDDTLDPPDASPLARPFEMDGVRVGNRFCILPMEGWGARRSRCSATGARIRISS